MRPTTRLLLAATALALAACGGPQTGGETTAPPLAEEETTSDAPERSTVQPFGEPTVALYMDPSARSEGTSSATPPSRDDVDALVADITLPERDEHPDALAWFSAVASELSPVISALGHRGSAGEDPEERTCTLAWMHDMLSILHGTAAYIGTEHQDDPSVSEAVFGSLTTELAGQVEAVEDELTAIDASPASCPDRQRIERPEWLSGE